MFAIDSLLSNWVHQRQPSTERIDSSRQQQHKSDGNPKINCFNDILRLCAVRRVEQRNFLLSHLFDSPPPISITSKNTSITENFTKITTKKPPTPTHRFQLQNLLNASILNIDKSIVPSNSSTESSASKNNAEAFVETYSPCPDGVTEIRNQPARRTEKQSAAEPINSSFFLERFLSLPTPKQNETGNDNNEKEFGTTPSDSDSKCFRIPNSPTLQPMLSRMIAAEESLRPPLLHSHHHRIGHPYASRVPAKHKKPRTSFNKSQIAVLENRFVDQKYLASTERVKLAQQLNMHDSQVKTWFQNRRTKWRRQEAEEREVEERALFRQLLVSHNNQHIDQQKQLYP